MPDFIPQSEEERTESAKRWENERSKRDSLVPQYMRDVGVDWDLIQQTMQFDGKGHFTETSIRASILIHIKLAQKRGIPQKLSFFYEKIYLNILNTVISEFEMNGHQIKSSRSDMAIDLLVF